MRDRADAPPRPPRRNPRGGKGGAEPRSVIRRREHQVLTLTGCFRHQLLLPRPYLVLTKPLRLDFQCQRGASVKIACKYIRDRSLSPIHQQLMTEAPTAIAPRWLHGSAPHPVQPRVRCPIHLGHPAFADLGGDGVRAEGGAWVEWHFALVLPYLRGKEAQGVV